MQCQRRCTDKKENTRENQRNPFVLKQRNPAKEAAGRKPARDTMLKESNALWIWVNQEYKKTPQWFFFIFKDYVQPRRGNLSLVCKPRPRFTPGVVQKPLASCSRYLHLLLPRAKLVHATSRWWPWAQILQHFQVDFVSIVAPKIKKFKKKTPKFRLYFIPFDFLCVHQQTARGIEYKYCPYVYFRSQDNITTTFCEGISPLRAVLPIDCLIE